MGIRGLGGPVRRYGIFTSLTGDTVVIDGPALVHQIFDGCMRQRPPTNGFICQPSYSALGRMVIRWLDELRGHDVTVRKIFFDGYLPPSKWQVRRERLIEQSQRMKDLLTSHPYGSSMLPEGAFQKIEGKITLTQNIGHSSYFNWLPRSPFLVPAVLEILKNCRTWGPLVEIVPGEADMFCAEDIRRHGGLLITSDSDLLITDLGPNGKVSFLGDIVAADPSDKSQGLVASKFSLNAISYTLGLNNVGGLPRVAFELTRCRVRFSDAIQRVRNNKDSALELSEFKAFMEEYSMQEYLPRDHPVKRILSTLDPRICEIIIQTLLLDGKRTVPDTSSARHFRGPETLSMFLPILIENRTRRSAWTMSTAIRRLAYGIMQMFAVHKSPVVIEYRLLVASNPSMGRQIDVSGPKEVVAQCLLLVDVLNQLTKRTPSVDMRWLAFAIYQDVGWSTSEEERSPLSASLLHNAKRTSNDGSQHSWDIIHFTAQTEASLYSLRMAKQALDAAMLLCPTLPRPLRELRGHLNTLPPIADWPTVENMSRKLATASGYNILPVITDLIGIPPIETREHSPVVDRSKQQKRRTGLLRSERDPQRPISVNPFAVLSSASLH